MFDIFVLQLALSLSQARIISTNDDDKKIAIDTVILLCYVMLYYITSCLTDIFVYITDVRMYVSMCS